jgi:hypothetical protein
MSPKKPETSKLNKLNDAAIAKATLPDGVDEFRLLDTEIRGFMVRIRKGGTETTKTFALRYRPAGSGRTEQPRMFTIGKFPDVNEKAARKVANIKKGDIANDGDPAADRRKQKLRERHTIEALIWLSDNTNDAAKPKKLSPYEADLIRRRKVKYQWSLSAVRRGLAKHMKLDIRDLTRALILDEMNRLTDEGKAGAAAYFRKEVGTFLTWVAHDFKLAGFVNPMEGYRKRKETRAERIEREPRGRALPPEEIIKVWNTAGMFGAFGRLVRLCQLGGPRRSEPTRTEWKKHVMDDRITFAARWTKMGLHHDIPRTTLVDSVLEDADRFRSATSDLVFPSSKTGGNIAGFSKLMPKLREASGVNFNLHDLRKTLRTTMSQCGFDNTIQRLCVGQKVRGIDAIYNHDEQWTIRKLAFEAVHDYIAELVGEKRSGKKIVRLNPLNKMRAELLGRLHELNASA